TLADGTVLGSGGPLSSENDNNFPSASFVNSYGKFYDSDGNWKEQYVGGKDTLGRVVVTQENQPNKILYHYYDSTGTQQTVTLNLGTITLSTHFNVNPGHAIGEFNGTRTVINSIVLANGQTYSFEYESNSYGGLTGITLPSGAHIGYVWSTLTLGELTHRYISSRTVTINGQNQTWDFDISNNGPNTVTGPAVAGVRSQTRYELIYNGYGEPR